MIKSLDKTMINKILMGVVGVSVLLIAGCSSDFEKGMKQSCRNTGGSRSFCSCFYDRIEEHYGKERLEAIGMMQVRMPEDFDEVSFKSGQQCAHKL